MDESANVSYNAWQYMFSLSTYYAERSSYTVVQEGIARRNRFFPLLLMTSFHRGLHPAPTGNLPRLRHVTFTSSEMHVDALGAASNLWRLQLYYWIISEIGIRESSELPSDFETSYLYQMQW